MSLFETKFQVFGAIGNTNEVFKKSSCFSDRKEINKKNMNLLRG